jgi:hypothetical protein
MNVVYVFYVSKDEEQDEFENVYSEKKKEVRNALQSYSIPYKAMDNICLYPNWKIITLPRPPGCNY